MRSEIDQLLVFFQVARLGSFTKAAKELYLTQPAVSAQVARLEQRLKVKLVERVGHRVFLTEAGNLVFSYADQVEQFRSTLEDLARAVTEMDTHLVGKLSVGASNTIGIYVLPSVMGRFKRQHPDVEMVLDVGISRNIVEGLVANRYDFALIEGPTKSPEIVTDHFTEDQLCLIVARDHPWARRTAEGVTIRDVQTQPFIGHREGSGTQTTIEREFQRRGLEIECSMAIDSPEAVKKVVEAGLGVSMVSKLIVQQEVERGVLVVVPVRDGDFRRRFKIAWRRGKRFSRVARTFLAFLREETGFAIALGNTHTPAVEQGSAPS